MVDLKLGGLAAAGTAPALFAMDQSYVAGREVRADGTSLPRPSSILDSRLGSASLVGVGFSPRSDNRLNFVSIFSAVFLHLGLLRLAAFFSPRGSGSSLMPIRVFLAPSLVLGVDLIRMALSPLTCAGLLLFDAARRLFMPSRRSLNFVRMGFGPSNCNAIPMRGKLRIGGRASFDVGSVRNPSAFATLSARRVAFGSVSIHAWFTREIPRQALSFSALSADLFQPFLHLREGSL